MQQRKTENDLDYWLVILIIVGTIFLGIANYLGWLGLHFMVGPFLIISGSAIWHCTEPCSSSMSMAICWQ